MSDGLQIGQDDEDTTLKEPGASTSRSLMDVDGQPLVGDSYGEPGFGSKLFVDCRRQTLITEPVTTLFILHYSGTSWSI